MQTYKKELIGFSGKKVHPGGFVNLYLTLGTRPRTLIIRVDFLMIDCLTTYNDILGRLNLNKIRAIVSTTCLTMKFFTDKREIAIMLQPSNVTMQVLK